MSRESGIRIETAGAMDRNLLLEMNRHLMEDEQYDRPPGDDALSRRWDEFLSLDRFGVFLFRASAGGGSDTADRVVGYAVVHMDDEPLYLRHFFIHREERRHSFGTACFHALLGRLGVTKIDLDVMS